MLSCSAGGGELAGAGGGGAQDSGTPLPDDSGSESALPLDAIGENAPPVGEVYAHSADTLYQLDPVSMTVTIVGQFSCVGDTSGGLGMWDIALDKNGKMFGSLQLSFNQGALVSIDPSSAACSILVQGSSFPNSLAFIPAGLLDPDQEVLVGFDVDDYVRIDTGTGKLQSIGGLNPNNLGKTLESSGDIVSIIGDKTYATVIDANGTGSDMIVELDPVTGKAIKLIGQTGYYKIWGLGYWGGTAYGFNEPGKLIEIDLSTGEGIERATNLPGQVSFWGAGVTTAAPIVMPK